MRTLIDLCNQLIFRIWLCFYISDYRHVCVCQVAFIQLTIPSFQDLPSGISHGHWRQLLLQVVIAGCASLCACVCACVRACVRILQNGSPPSDNIQSRHFVELSHALHVLNAEDLTRINKICHPSRMHRRQVDKEAIGLSIVQQCSSTCNPPS